MQYQFLVMGGTFDHLHAGHRKLISEALRLSQKVLLGLTVSEMNAKKGWKDSILPYEERKREVEGFVRSLKRLEDLEIIPIHDVFGTTLSDDKLEAILVTPHSVHGAEVINLERKKRSLPELPIHVCELYTDEVGQVLSSTRIREGVVNRSGFAYELIFKQDIAISENIKEYVRKPLGDSHFSFPQDLTDSNFPLIFVGDVVTETAVKMQLPIASAWIDGRSHREEYSFPIHPPYQLVGANLVNEPGSIGRDAAAFMKFNLLSNSKIFKIEGEEDLLTLVAILLSPLNSRVIYGNPIGQKGVTVVHVTEEKKEEIRGLLEQL